MAADGLPTGRGEERGDLGQTPALSSGFRSGPCWGGFSAAFPPGVCTVARSGEPCREGEQEQLSCQIWQTQKS